MKVHREVALVGALALVLAGSSGCDGDARLEQRIDARLASEGLEQIDATVDEGVVTLRGTATSVRDRFRAEGLARGTRGVRWVQNEIVVPLWPGDADPTPAVPP